MATLDKFRQVIILMMQFDMILKHVQTCHNAFDAIWYNSQTCLILFRINVIWIVTIHMIFKHVYSCSESIWYELIQFLNMSKHDEIHKIWVNGTHNSLTTKLFLGPLRRASGQKSNLLVWKWAYCTRPIITPSWFETIFSTYHKKSSTIAD